MAFIGIATSLIQYLATLTAFIALDLTTRSIQPFQKSCEPHVSSNNYIGDSKTALNEKGEILIKNIKKAKILIRRSNQLQLLLGYSVEKTASSVKYLHFLVHLLF